MRRLIPAVAFCAALALAGCEEARGSAAEAPPAEAAAIAVETLATADLAGMIERGEVQLIDVRTAEEFAEGHIAGALNMPVESFDPAAIPAADGKETILYCRSGRRSERAATMLAEATGGKVRHLGGGITAWEESGEPVTAGEIAAGS